MLLGAGTKASSRPLSLALDESHACILTGQPQCLSLALNFPFLHQSYGIRTYPINLLNSSPYLTLVTFIEILKDLSPNKVTLSVLGLGILHTCFILEGVGDAGGLDSEKNKNKEQKCCKGSGWEGRNQAQPPHQPSSQGSPPSNLGLPYLASLRGFQDYGWMCAEGTRCDVVQLQGAPGPSRS